jgi:hypothetical protein
MDEDEDKDKHILQKEEEDGVSNPSILQIPNNITSGYATNDEHDVQTKSTEDINTTQPSGHEIASGRVQADQWILDRVSSSNEKSNPDEDPTSSQSLLCDGEVATLQVKEDQLVSVSGNIIVCRVVLHR